MDDVMADQRFDQRPAGQVGRVDRVDRGSGPDHDLIDFVSLTRAEQALDATTAAALLAGLIPIAEADPAAHAAVDAVRRVVDRCEESVVAALGDWWLVAGAGDKSSHGLAWRLGDFGLDGELLSLMDQVRDLAARLRPSPLRWLVDTQQLPGLVAAAARRSTTSRTGPRRCRVSIRRAPWKRHSPPCSRHSNGVNLRWCPRSVSIRAAAGSRSGIDPPNGAIGLHIIVDDCPGPDAMLEALESGDLDAADDAVVIAQEGRRERDRLVGVRHEVERLRAAADGLPEVEARAADVLAAVDRGDSAVALDQVRELREVAASGTRRRDIDRHGRLIDDLDAAGAGRRRLDELRLRHARLDEEPQLAFAPGELEKLEDQVRQAEIEARRRADGAIRQVSLLRRERELAEGADALVDQATHEAQDAFADGNFAVVREATEVARTLIERSQIESWRASEGELRLVEHIERFIQGDFDFSRSDIRRLHVALKTKPFVVLAGLTGSGKSTIARLFAERYFAEALSAMEEARTGSTARLNLYPEGVHPSNAEQWEPHLGWPRNLFVLGTVKRVAVRPRRPHRARECQLWRDEGRRARDRAREDLGRGVRPAASRPAGHVGRPRLPRGTGDDTDHAGRPGGTWGGPETPAAGHPGTRRPPRCGTASPEPWHRYPPVRTHASWSVSSSHRWPPARGGRGVGGHGAGLAAGPARLGPPAITVGRRRGEPHGRRHPRAARRSRGA